MDCCVRGVGPGVNTKSLESGVGVGAGESRVFLQTVLMESTRVKDWLIGATGMVLLLGMMAAILW